MWKALNKYFEFNQPTHILCGENSLDIFLSSITNMGKNFLLISSKEIIHLEKKLLKNLLQMDINIHTFYLESPEPTVQFIDTSVKNLVGKKFDCIIALGGGSSIDFAKSLSIVLTNPDSIWMYPNRANFIPHELINELIPIVAIPTTSGSGSEVTPYAVITNSINNQRSGIKRDEIIPKTAILDPLFLTDMPLELTSSTGMDALAHSIESYLNISKFSPASEWAACESLRLIFEFLPKVIQEPSNSSYRLKMAWASTLAGIAISNRGTTTCHAIAEALGGITKIPHGHSVAISTLPVLEKTLEKNIQKLSDLNDLVFGNSSKSPEEKSKYFVNKVKQLIETIGLSRTAKDYLKDDDFKKLSSEIFSHVYNYKFRALDDHIVKFSKDEISTIINIIVGIRS
jgi:alcohol dehydrogenase class IV